MPSLAIQNYTSLDLHKQRIFRKEFKLPQKYIFYPSMYLPHKNHITLIDSLRLLKKIYKMDLSAVFCGNDIGYLDNLKNYALNNDLTNSIFFLDFVKDEYLPYLYLDASVLVMPSLIGPTNIPPWEAFAMQVPVIYSNLEGIQSVLKDAALYINPLNSKDIAETIFKLLTDDDLKKDLILKGNKRIEEVKNNNEFDIFFQIIKRYQEFLRLFKN